MKRMSLKPYCVKRKMVAYSFSVRGCFFFELALETCAPCKVRKLNNINCKLLNMFILYTNFSKPLAPFTSRTIAYISSFHWRLSIANCYCDTGFFLVETYLSKYCQKPVELFNACVLFTLIYSVCKTNSPVSRFLYLSETFFSWDTYSRTPW